MAAVGQLCPDDARARGAQQVIRPARRRRAAPVTTFIIAVTAAVFLVGLVSTDIRQELFAAFAQVNVLVAAGEWWRLITPVLLHASITHILFNMWALWQLGPRIEQSIGTWSYALAYLAAAAWGGAFAFWMGGRDMVAVGASGAIFGLFGMWLVAAFHRRETRFGRSLLSQLGGLLVINALLPLFLPGIAWQAHLGGLLAGVAMAELWRKVDGQTARAAVNFGMLVAAVAAVML
jgi:membrane associated rhomboid family serine protease